MPKPGTDKFKEMVGKVVQVRAFESPDQRLILKAVHPMGRVYMLEFENVQGRAVIINAERIHTITAEE